FRDQVIGFERTKLAFGLSAVVANHRRRTVQNDFTKYPREILQINWTQLERRPEPILKLNLLGAGDLEDLACAPEKETRNLKLTAGQRHHPVYRRSMQIF